MIYALDVDGVLFDSRKQIIVDTFNTYLYFFRSTKIFGNQKLTFKNYESLLNSNSKIVDYFYEKLNYTRNAEEQVFIFYSLENNIAINNESDYRKEFAKISVPELNLWHNEFYKQREEFQKQGKWQSMVTPFQISLDFLKRNLGISVILSNKDKSTISSLLSFNGINLGLDKIYSKEITTDKNEKLRKIAQDFNIPLNKIIFIDDNLLNIKDANALGVHCYLASWGFNNQAEREEAIKLGISVLALENLKNI